MSCRGGVAAIASVLAGNRFGVPVVAPGINDDLSNSTRFLVLAPHAKPFAPDVQYQVMSTTPDGSYDMN